MSRRALMENAVGVGGKTLVYVILTNKSVTSAHYLINSPGTYFFRIISRSDASKANAVGAKHFTEEAQKTYKCTMDGKSVICVFTYNQYGAVWIQLSGISSTDSVTFPIELTFTVDGIMYYLVIGTDSDYPSNFPPLSLNSDEYLIPTIMQSCSSFSNNTTDPFDVLM